MKNSQKNAAGVVKNKLVPITVRLSEAVYSALHKLSEEFDVSFSYVVRLAIERELEKYLGNVRYIDREQGAEIMAAVNELTAVCRDILNNVHRIGINYNQELRRKIAKKNLYDVLSDNNASEYRRIEAKNEYDKETADIQETCLNKDELKDILTRFEAAAEKAEVLSWHIHE